MVIPAILESNQESLQRRLKECKQMTGLQTVQIDFTDGVFVRGRTLRVKELPPLDSQYNWEAHLMVESPQDFFDYHEAGFSKIIVHYEAYGSETALLQAVQAITAVKCVPAVAVNPETPILVLRNLIGVVSHFTLMSVYPGRQGNAFINSIYERVKQVRALSPSVVVEVDGGINLNNATLLVDAGAQELAVGSALFGGGDPADNFARLQRAIAQ